MKIGAALLVAGALSIGASACGSGSDSSNRSSSTVKHKVASGTTSATSVDIRDFKYNPDEVFVHVGETVTWINRDTTEHTATMDDGSGDTGLLRRSESGSQSFTAPGVFRYHCTPHPFMKGKVTVLPDKPGGDPPESDG